MEGEPLFKNGHWAWNEGTAGIYFISHELPKKMSMAPVRVKKAAKQTIPSSIRFKENIDNLEKIMFRRFYQRRAKPNDIDVITIQDIKDVALFLANPKDLSVEFINYFHLPEIDRFLKAVIIYFHFYLQVWEQILDRREEIRRKLRQPVVTVLENQTRDNLSDVRSLLAREYCTIILGIGEIHRFHHLFSSTNSLSEKDRRLIEALICMTVRVAWIALQRRHLPLIELELNRILRTDLFNIVLHRNKPSKSVWRTQEEDRVLAGLANVKETKLKQKSALMKELLLVEHDCRMLGIGFKHFEPECERINYLETIFAATEEILFDKGVSIGLVGIPREEYDCMMMPRERTSKNFDKPILEPLYFVLPARKDIPDVEMPKTFPKEPCQYKESEQIVQARKAQCKIWRLHVHRSDRSRTVSLIT